MATSRGSLMMIAGVVLIAVAILVRVAFGATTSQAASGDASVLAVWAATIGLFLGGLYLLAIGSKGRKQGMR